MGRRRKGVRGKGSKKAERPSRFSEVLKYEPDPYCVITDSSHHKLCLTSKKSSLASSYYLLIR